MRNLLLTLLLFIVSLAFDPVSAADKESVYDRVMRTGVIRCGYFIEPPFLQKDPNTGEVSGLVPDMMKTMAAQLGLKVEWTQEINTAFMVEDLMNDRYDMTCSSVWIIPERIKVVDHSVPYLYALAHAYVRKGETRIKSLSEINQESIKVAYSDGDAVSRLIKRNFPEASLYALPEFSVNEYLNVVALGKADVAISIDSVFTGFDQNNPGKLRQVASDKPVFVIPNAFMFKRGQTEFKNMIDATLRLMIANGELETLAEAYKGNGKTFALPASPY